MPTEAAASESTATMAAAGRPPPPPASFNGATISTAINAVSGTASFIGAPWVLGNGGYVAVGGGLNWTAKPFARASDGTLDDTDFIGGEPTSENSMTLLGNASSRGARST